MKKFLLFSTVLLLTGTCAMAQEKASKKATQAAKAERASEAEALKAKRLAEKKAIELQNAKSPVAPKAAQASIVDPRSN